MSAMTTTQTTETAEQPRYQHDYSMVIYVLNPVGIEERVITEHVKRRFSLQLARMVACGFYPAIKGGMVVPSCKNKDTLKRWEMGIKSGVTDLLLIPRFHPSNVSKEVAQ